MHTRATVPHLLISDQTYLFNAYLVFILLFESNFFKSTLAAFLSTSNFSPIGVHRLFSTSLYLWSMSALLYKQGYSFTSSVIFPYFFIEAINYIYLYLFCCQFSQIVIIFVFVCFLSLNHSFCEIVRQKLSKKESIFLFWITRENKENLVVVKNW